MPTTKISTLTALGAVPASGDLLIVRDVSADSGAGLDRSVTVAEVLTNITIQASAPADATLANLQAAFYVNGTSLSVKWKDSGGTVRTATI